MQAKVVTVVHERRGYRDGTRRVRDNLIGCDAAIGRRDVAHTTCRGSRSALLQTTSYMPSRPAALFICSASRGANDASHGRSLAEWLPVRLELSMEPLSEM